MDAGHIRVKVLCLFVRTGKTLVAKLHDPVRGADFYRLLGGTLDFYETAENGVRREIREELDSEVDNLALVKVVENLFVFKGQQGHEIVFVYKGDLQKKELYDQKIIHIVEPTYEFDAEWVDIAEILKGTIPLYPALDYKALLIHE